MRSDPAGSGLNSPDFGPAPRTAVFVSGTGRSLLNLLARERAGRLSTEIALVIASKAGLLAESHAARFGVQTLVLPPKDIARALLDQGIELAVLAGYLKRWPIPEAFEGRALNIHPALLPLFGGPGFYGDRVHEAVLASGMRVSGATVHFVTEAYDAGPILAQAAVPVRPTDDVPSLAARVFAAECELLPRAIEDLVCGRLRLRNGRLVSTLP